MRCVDGAPRSNTSPVLHRSVLHPGQALSGTGETPSVSRLGAAQQAVGAGVITPGASHLACAPPAAGLLG